MDSQLVPVLAGLMAFSAVLLLGLGILGAKKGQETAQRLRDKVVVAAGGPGAAELPSLWSRLSGAALDLARQAGGYFGPKDAGSADVTRLTLIRAGLRSPGALAQLHGAKAALAILPPCLLLLAAWLLPKAPPAHMLVIGTLALALFGSKVPDIWLSSKLNERRDALLRELPDALDLLVVCVESGMGLDQAIHRVSEELACKAPVICAELKTMTLEMRAGRKRQQALRDLAERTGLEDVQSLATLLIQADLFGISVARTLRVYSDTLRTARFQRAEELAAKLPIKLMFPLILCIFPALFVIIMGPAALQLMHVFSRMGQ